MDQVPTAARVGDVAAPVVLLCAAAVLTVVAVSLRVAGFLGVMDQVDTVAGAFEAGRSQGVRAAVLLFVAAGLTWAALRGLTDQATRRSTCARGGTVMVVGAAVSLVLGGWVTGLVLAVPALALAVAGRRRLAS
ncbi:hypothetical protein ICW40_16355 [Actinotalea ferrariae]|uniref:hypothetical protein n=1 Tax=Actinotalea ferrariae TaxID=1386098 RepID=UPI001C8B75F6|nr:hypothetical protein [Actinotalea ferrariae]MBX9246367.1 hypothetical protein [Actinotalea ferrariae]